MMISAKLAVIMCAIFAAMCFGVAITGFTSLGDITDPVKRADGYGFAWFWTFLGFVAVLFGFLSAWIMRAPKDGEN